MNYVTEYQPVDKTTGKKGIFCKMNNSKLGIIKIIVGIDEQIARRIIFMVTTGFSLNQSLEDDLPYTEDLFDMSKYRKQYEPDFGGFVFVHKDF